MAKLLSLVGFCAIFCVCSGFEFSKEWIEFMGNLTMGELPKDLQLLLQKTTKIGNHDNWCCKTHSKILYKEVTQRVLRTSRITQKFNTGSHGCHFMSLSRCSSYSLRYAVKQQYYTQRRIIPQHQECPSSQLICCPGYVLVAGQCIDSARLKDAEFREQLQRLKENGIAVGR